MSEKKKKDENKNENKDENEKYIYYVAQNKSEGTLSKYIPNKIKKKRLFSMKKDAYNALSMDLPLSIKVHAASPANMNIISGQTK